MKRNMRGAGFTLIELMIVVAIIGILAAIAIPKFSEILRKSKEGKTKGNLGALKSALTLYYSEMEGTMYPGTSLADGADLTVNPGAPFHPDGPFLTKYMQLVDAVKLGPGSPHDDSARVDLLEDPNGVVPDTGRWIYCSTSGQIGVGCSHTDSRGTTIISW